MKAQNDLTATERDAIYRKALAQAADERAYVPVMARPGVIERAIQRSASMPPLSTEEQEVLLYGRR